MGEIVLIPPKATIPGLILMTGPDDAKEVHLIYSSRKRVKIYDVVKGRCEFGHGCIKYKPHGTEYYSNTVVDRLIRDKANI